MGCAVTIPAYFGGGRQLGFVLSGGNTNDCTRLEAALFDRDVYRLRNVVEPCFNCLNQWRGLATRYGKTSKSYQAAVTIASIVLRI
ncbi:hypothetical protein ACFC1T_32750 [Kitasatospora sp. NPDC056076]|uniref:hypothetical protein n=1 Tax=Kitasatospora sp. NPDC056076 TaxID=3345703 RepID=UPI0035DDFAA5